MREAITFQKESPFLSHSLIFILPPPLRISCTPDRPSIRGAFHAIQRRLPSPERRAWPPYHFFGSGKGYIPALIKCFNRVDPNEELTSEAPQAFQAFSASSLIEESRFFVIVSFIDSIARIKVGLYGKAKIIVVNTDNKFANSFERLLIPIFSFDCHSSLSFLMASSFSRVNFFSIIET